MLNAMAMGTEILLQYTSLHHFVHMHLPQGYVTDSSACNDAQLLLCIREQ